MAGNAGGFSLSVHTIDGIQIGDLPCAAIPDITWGRESNEVSRCEFTAINSAAPDVIAAARPWLHWATVWDGPQPVWTGPVQRVTVGTASAVFTCRDMSTYMWRTRTPISRTWVDIDPAAIAATLWQAMIDKHKIRAVPQVLENAEENFTISAVADSRMLNQNMDDLTKIGLKWCVVAGTPLLGRPPDSPVTTLGECDFLAELQIIRDGTATFNDVRVQGKNFAQTAIVPLAGLHLQTLVSLDDMFGVSNIQKATQQYARDVAVIRDVLTVPSSASLHPDAPVDLADLVPGNHFRVDAKGLSALLRLDQMQVTAGPGKYDVQVTMESVTDKSEIAELAGVSSGGIL